MSEFPEGLALSHFRADQSKKHPVDLRLVKSKDFLRGRKSPSNVVFFIFDRNSFDVDECAVEISSK